MEPHFKMDFNLCQRCKRQGKATDTTFVRLGNNGDTYGIQPGTRVIDCPVARWMESLDWLPEVDINFYATRCPYHQPVEPAEGVE